LVVSRLRHLLAGLLFLFLPGCGLAGSSQPVSSGPSPAAAMSTAQRFAGARPAVETYLKALALHREADAQPVVQAAGSYANQLTLNNLRTWFAALPLGDVKMTAKPVAVPDPDSVGVRVSISARFSPAPLSTWVALGDRVMLAHYDNGAWRVAADISQRRAVHTRAYGLRLFNVPTVLTGKHSTVIYEAVEANQDATQILSDADEVVPQLTGLFGRDRAAAHPIIYVISSRKQGEQLSGVQIVRKELPEGFVVNGVAYIEWPVWDPGNVLERDGTIAHELTHVASSAFLGRSPHSLLEGLAMYEEDRYLRTIGVHIPLSAISQVYAHGSFPSVMIWRTRVTDWGLRNPGAVNLCYEDGQAMTAVIMERHGGAAGLGRLARAFNAMHPSHKGALYSEAQVRDAFQRGLGVSFDQVVAEAHAYAAANAH
jgi:hypothetical protein